MNHQLTDGNQFNKSRSVLQMTTNNARILNRNLHYSKDMISESLSIMISTKLATPLTICKKIVGLICIEVIFAIRHTK